MDNYFAEALWKLCENDKPISEFIIADSDNLGEILRKLCENDELIDQFIIAYQINTVINKQFDKQSLLNSTYKSQNNLLFCDLYSI